MIGKYFLSHICLFILFIISFAVQKLFNLMWSHLFILAVVAYAFGVISPKLLPRPVLLCFFPICSSRGFMIFSLTFKSLTRFQFFSELCETGFQFHCFFLFSFFFFFACEYLVFPTPFIYWRDYILPCEYYWLPCQVLDDHICMCLFYFTIKENHTIYRKISNCGQMF